MAMPAKALPLESFPPPDVNREKSGRAVLHEVGRALTKTATAGASGAIDAPESAWERYAADAGLGTVMLMNEAISFPITTNVVQPIGEATTFRGLFVDPDTVYMFQAPIGTPLVVTNLSVDPLSVYRSNQRIAADSREDALRDIRRRLDALKATHAHSSPRDVVNYLSEEIGVGQLAIARAVGVSPTAVRKWRRGEPTRAEHRSRLAQFAALCSLLDELGPHDPAGWLDIPLSDESDLTPLDLFTAGRSDLVVLHGTRLAGPHETLDEFDPGWRTNFGSDPDYEVMTLADGSRSILPRSGPRA